MNKVYPFVLSILMTASVHAELSLSEIKSQSLKTFNAQDATLSRTGLASNEDDIPTDQDISQIHLTEEKLHEAKVWGLTLDEEKRYLLLMQNRSQIYYKGLRLTPLDILGLNARNESERNHLARLAAQQEAQKVAKNIAWNNAFHKAYNEIFKQVPVIGDFDPAPYSPYAHQPIHLNSGDKLYFFLKQTDPIKSILYLLIDAIETTPDTQLHIMLLNADDITIQQWANQHQLPQHLINNGKLSLNHGELNYQALKLQKTSTPLLLLSQNNTSHVVDLGRF